MSEDPRYNRRLRPWPSPPRVGSAGEPPVQSRRAPTPPENVIVERECYSDSKLLDGRMWPIRQAWVFDLDTTQQEKFRVCREVPCRLYISVYDAGVADIYIDGLGQRVGTDLPHFRIGHDPRPIEVLLPPGDHRFTIYAQGALQVSIVAIEEVGR